MPWRLRIAIWAAALGLSGSWLPGQTLAPTDRALLVREGNVWPHLREQLRALGDRLGQPGKERSTLVGTLARGVETAVPVMIVTEKNGRIRIEEGFGANQRVYGFSGTGVWTGSGTSRTTDADAIETLLYDTAERFFLTQANGTPTRFYGAKLRFDNGRTPNYQGPYYDVYEVWDEIGPAGRARRPKVYCLNWQTQLLERVQYSIARGSGRTMVEVVLDNWQTFGGQRYPGRIVRSENREVVLTIQITSGGAGPTADDGVFEPRGR